MPLRPLSRRFWKNAPRFARSSSRMTSKDISTFMTLPHRTCRKLFLDTQKMSLKIARR